MGENTTNLSGIFWVSAGNLLRQIWGGPPNKGLEDAHLIV